MNLRHSKVMVSLGCKQAYSQSKGSRDHITVNCATVSAAGIALSPMIIFKKTFPSTVYVTQEPINALYAKYAKATWMKSCFIAVFQNRLFHKHST